MITLIIALTSLDLISLLIESTLGFFLSVLIPLEKISELWGMLVWYI